MVMIEIADASDVPEELVDAIASVLDDDAHEGCDDGGCPGNVRPYYESVVRAALVQGLPERDRAVRARVADEIEAELVRDDDGSSWGGGMARAVQIARSQAAHRPDLLLPRRGDAVATWLKAHRDEFELHSAEWHALNDLLDEYRLRADTGHTLNQPLDVPPFA